MWVNMMGEQKKFIAGDGSVKNLQKEQHNQNKRNTVGKNFTADLNRIEFLFPASHIFSYGFTAVVVRCSFSFIYLFFFFFVITNWQWHEWREIFNLNKRRRQRSFRRLLLLFLGSRAAVVCIVGWLWSELICEEKAKCQLNFGTVERRDIDHRHKENM